MRRPYFSLQPCLCLCGRLCGWHWFKPGHDARALAQVLKDHYQGSARRFIRQNGGDFTGGHPWPAALKFAKQHYGSIIQAVLAHR